MPPRSTLVVVNSPVSRGVAAVSDAAASAATGEDLFAQVSDQLRKLVPYDGSAWFAADPATVMPSAPVRIENVEPGHCEAYWERENSVEDVLRFRDLARSESGVGTLDRATDGARSRSARSREFLAPQGYGDELRATFRIGASTWGLLSVFRDQSRAAFSGRDIELVTGIAPALGRALRGLAAAAGAPADATEVPGTLLFDEAGHLVSLDGPAEHWIGALAGPDWTPDALADPAWVGRVPELSPLTAVIARARVVAIGREVAPATTRLRARSGRWLVLQASALHRPGGGSAQVAVTIGPAKSAQIAPIIVEAYGLTGREQQITQAVARGLSNAEIGAQLFLSPYTVRDHLKAIFAKVGVGSRGELVAKLFADHYGPALHAAPDPHAQF